MSTLTLARQNHPLSDPGRQLELIDQGKPFEESLAETGRWPLRAIGIEVLQINVGKMCNQTCAHCHVDAGPDRRESMSAETAELCLDVLARHEIPTLDITGGAPELNPNFRRLVARGRELGRRVIDRCNLTILLVQGYAELPRSVELRVGVVWSGWT